MARASTSTDPATITKKYLGAYQIQELLKLAVDELIEKKPNDPSAALSDFFRKRSFLPFVDHLVGREVLDSDGNPVLEVDVYASHLGKVFLAARSSCPSTADNDQKRFKGKGTLLVAKEISENLSPILKGMQLSNQIEFDKKITQQERDFTAASYALAKAASNTLNEPLFQYFARNYRPSQPQKKFKLPSLLVNLISSPYSDFLICPARKNSFPDQIRISSEIYHSLGSIISQDISISAKNVGQEGNFVLDLPSPSDYLNLIEKAVVKSGLTSGDDVFFAIFNHDLQIKKENYFVGDKSFTSKELINYYNNLIKEYPGINMILDPFDKINSQDWKNWTSEVGAKMYVVGREYLEGLVNSFMLKMEGTITCMFEKAQTMDRQGLQLILAQEGGGDTADSLISDFAVGIGAQFLKIGSIVRGEKIEKYTRLLQIYEDLQKEGQLVEE